MDELNDSVSKDPGWRAIKNRNDNELQEASRQMCYEEENCAVDNATSNDSAIRYMKDTLQRSRSFGCEYPTSNLFLQEVQKIKSALIAMFFNTFGSQTTPTTSTYHWDDFDAYCEEVETAEPTRSELVDYLEKDNGSRCFSHTCYLLWLQKQPLVLDKVIDSYRASLGAGHEYKTLVCGAIASTYTRKLPKLKSFLETKMTTAVALYN
nr:zinc finger BED domain-containing protein RICESLEEPER 2-like [Ipomoea batatas]